MPSPEELQDKNENFRMYHQLQYDRIDKLESKRETFSNLTITITIGVFSFVYTKDVAFPSTIISWLPYLLVVINMIAIKFAFQSRYFIKMHQERARKAREQYAPELEDINKSVDKKDGNKDRFNRNWLYVFLHVILIALSFWIKFGS